MYTLILADGTKIEGLRMNGDNFISETKVDEELFEDNLSTLTISDGETVTVKENVQFIQQVECEDGFYFCFRTLSEQEIQMATMMSKLEYLAMMTDVDIDEEV